jgi:hypothetical protein
MIDSGLTNSGQITSGTTTSITLSSNPSSIYSVNDNLFLQNGTNLGTITAVDSSSITIGGGINQTISASTKLYKEGSTSTNEDTSKILERNLDQLYTAYNFFNFNKTLAENAITTIVTIAKQQNITLKLEVN